MLLIADVIFDKSQRTLIKGDRSRALEPKSFDLLVLLLSKKGQITTRNELIEVVWKSRVVGEGAINRTVSILRGHFLALTETEIIETVPTQGYRLVAEVSDSKTVSYRGLILTLKNAISRKIFLVATFILFIILIVSYTTFDGEEAQRSEQAISLNLMDDPLVGLDGYEYDVSSTTNGKTLLFHYFSNSSTSQKSNYQEVLLYDTESHKKQKILENSIAAISPSGKYVAYVNYESQQCEYVLYNVANKSSKSLTPCDTPPSHISWGANHTVYFNKRISKSHPYQVFGFNIQTNQLTQISNPNSGSNTKGDFNFAYNAKTNILSVVRYINEQKSQIVFYKNNVQVADYTIDLAIKSTAWHPIKSRLLMSDRSTIYAFNPEMGDYTKIKELNTNVKSLATASSNNQPVLLISSANIKSSVVKRTLADGVEEVWQKSGKAEMLPRVKEKTKLVLSTRYKSHRWWRVNQDDAQIVKADLPFDLKFVRYEISHDENAVLFTKNGVVYELDIRTGKLLSVFNDHDQSYVVNYDSRNKDDLVYSSNQTGQWQLWYYNRASNQHSQLTQKGGYSGRVVGDYLYFSKYTVDGLWRLSLSSQQENVQSEELVINDFSRVNWLNWQVLGNNVYFYRKESGVWRYNLDTSSEELVFQAPANFVHQYTISPDQKSIYWVKLEPVEGDIFQYVIK